MRHSTQALPIAINDLLTATMAERLAPDMHTSSQYQLTVT